MTVHARKTRNKTALKLPGRYRELKSLPGDPPDSVPFGYTSGSAECFLLVTPVEPSAAMPFCDPLAVIDGIHDQLSEAQGLIEVRNGVTRDGRPYIYSVVKTLQKPRGVQYTLSLYLENEGRISQIQGFFTETGVTGARDATIFAWMENQGMIEVTEKGAEGWVRDPYDPFYTRGVPMTLAEQPQFDALFPAHPLSELRKFVAEMLTPYAERS